jgi:hypothetical protein
MINSKILEIDTAKLTKALQGNLTRHLLRLKREAREQAVVINPKKIKAAIEAQITLKVQTTENVKQWELMHDQKRYDAEQKAIESKMLSAPANALAQFILGDEDTAARLKKIKRLEYALACLDPAKLQEPVIRAPGENYEVHIPHELIDKLAMAEIQRGRLAQLCRALDHIDDAALAHHHKVACEHATAKLVTGDKQRNQEYFQSHQVHIGGDRVLPILRTNYRKQLELANKDRESEKKALVSVMPTALSAPQALLSEMLQAQHELYQQLHAKRGIGKSKLIEDLEKLQACINKNNRIEDLGPDFAPILSDEELTKGLAPLNESEVTNYCASQHLSVILSSQFAGYLMDEIKGLRDQEKQRYTTDVTHIGNDPLRKAEQDLLQAKIAVLDKLDDKLSVNTVTEVLNDILDPSNVEYNVLWRHRNEHDPRTPAIITAFQALQAAVDEPGRITVKNAKFVILASKLENTKSFFKGLGASLSKALSGSSETAESVAAPEAPNQNPYEPGSARPN